MNLNQPLVSFVIVNYGNIDDTVECIDSIYSITYHNYNIIIIDNSDTCEYYERLLSLNLDKTKVYKSKNNRGFAAGCNIGIQKAQDLGAEYVLLINNDTVIKSPNLIEELLYCFKKPNVGMVGCKILYYDNPDKCWYSAGYISPIRLKAKCRNLKKRSYTPFVTGCLQMIDINTFKAIGPLAEEYFLYYEDADYCKRLLNANIKIVYTPYAVICHKVSQSISSSSSKSVYYSNRARFLYIKRFEKNNYPALFCFWMEFIIKLCFYKREKRKALTNLLYEIMKKTVNTNLI